MRKNKISDILSRPTKEIIISILIILFGSFVLFNSNIDSIIRLVIGLTTIVSGIYYLIIEDWKSPIFFSLSVVASGVFTVLFLESMSADLIGYVLSMQMFLYFSVLSINYINEVKGNKKFVLSGLISLSVTIFARLIQSDKLEIYTLIFSLCILILYFAILFILKRKESHE